MPILMPHDTREALGDNAAKCDSRSLLLDRFADPEAREGPRKAIFENAIRKTPSHHKTDSWTAWLGETAPATGAETLYAQLQSRLVLNMAGGVMENAGLCIDRFGMPYIPGSAIKGCARRMALAALREWSETGNRPGDEPGGTENLFRPICADLGSPEEMLAAIAQVFGWCDQDWEPKSDFRWACGNNPEERLAAAADLLLADFGERKGEAGNGMPWKNLPNFSGSIAFLPAYSIDLGKAGKLEGLPAPLPSPGTLELDIVTCHHRNYYSGANPNAVATDTEEPNPVVFPAVAPGHVFTFALAPLRDTAKAHLARAKTWLSGGLSTFGIGAKTNAGYGWFDASESTHGTVLNFIKDRAEAKRKADQQEKEAEEAARKKAEEEKKKAELTAKLEGLSPEEREDLLVREMPPQQFQQKLRAFFKEPRRGGPRDEEKKAMVRALRGPMLAVWEEFKSKAKSGDLARSCAEIRQLSKQMFPGAEGKMP